MRAVRAAVLAPMPSSLGSEVLSNRERRGAGSTAGTEASTSAAGQAAGDPLSRPPLGHRPKRPPLLRLKIISMGEPASGKSCLIKRYCEERYVAKYISTIGVDYGVKPQRFGATDARLNLWDLAGGAEYLEVRNEFYKVALAASRSLCAERVSRGHMPRPLGRRKSTASFAPAPLLPSLPAERTQDAQGALLVFDVNDRGSFGALESWLDEARRYGARSVPAVVCGNKVRRAEIFHIRWHKRHACESALLGQ